jgi:hypothetical protein
MTQIYNFPDHKKGDTFKAVAFTLLYSDTLLPISLQGASIECQFRLGSRTGAKVHDVNSTSGITIIDGLAGKFKLNQLTNIYWDVGTYFYDIEITFADGVIRTYVEGSITITQDTTYG